MKKFLTICTLALMLVLPCMSVSAYTTPSGTTSGNTGGSGGGGGGSGGNTQAPVGGSTGDIDGNISGGHLDGTVTYPFEVYTPKVTYIKSVNAALANYDGIPVYFMPRLEDFPTDLEDVVSDLTDNSGVRHQFAAVYTGYRRCVRDGSCWRYK